MVDPGDDVEVLALLLTFFAQTEDFVGVSDPWGRVLYLNPAAQKRLGIVDAADLSLADLFPPETFARYYDVIRPALLSTGAWSGEILVNAAGSVAVPMHVSTVAKIGPGGEVDGSVMIGRELVVSGQPAGGGILDGPAFKTRVARSIAASARDDRDAPVTMAEFRVATSQGDVVPYAQPVVDLPSGLVIGYRGLARWRHRRLGQLEAKAFIEMIAGTSSASTLDLYVAREVAAMLLLTARFVALRMYTPASARLIGDVRTEHYLSEIADAFCLPMHQIHLQLGRPLVEQAPPTFADSLRGLADAGIGFVLTGAEDPADVELLAGRPFREVHLSRRLTQAAASDPDALRTVSEIVRRAHGRALLVAATGVIDRAHERALLAADCDLGTGGLYGEPEPAAAIEEPASPPPES